MLTGQEPFYPIFRTFLAQIAAGALVLDLGTPEPFREELGLLRESFAGARYLAVDYPGPGPLGCHVGADLRRLPFRDGVADGIICKEVLEHVDDPFTAVTEMARVLRPGGWLFLTVPFLAPYHAAPGSYEDYWRFTRAGVAAILSGFRSVEIERYGGVPYMLSTAYLPGAVRRALMSWPLGSLFWALDRRWGRTSTIMHMALAQK